MAINRNNYGAYFLDYWESNLDEQAKSALASFLKANPDLQDEFFDFKDAVNASFPEEDLITYPDKRILKKIEVRQVGEINQMNWEYYVIASIEGDLSNEMSAVFQEFVRLNPQINEEIRLYRKAHLIPDQSIVFPEKPMLKRRVLPLWTASPTLKRWVSVAAVILIALVLYRNDGLFRTSVDSTPQMAENESYIDDSALITDKPADFQADPTSIAGNSPSEPVKKFSVDFPLPAVADQQNNSSLFVENESHRSDNEDVVLAKMDIRSHAGLIEIDSVRNQAPATRTDFSEIFDYLLIRDGLVAEESTDKSLAGKVLANLKNSFSREEIQPVQGLFSPLITGVAESGRDVLNRSGLFLPVLNKLEEDGRKETSFALSETLNFRLSRVKNSPD